MAETDLLTEPQAAKHLGVSAKTLSRWRKAGAVGHFLTPGGSIRYRPSHIARLLADMDVAPMLGPQKSAYVLTSQAQPIEHRFTRDHARRPQPDPRPQFPGGDDAGGDVPARLIP